MTTIVVLPGDGIGRVVIPEALRVLEAVGLRADYVHGEIGWDCWVRDGEALPQRTVALLERHQVGLFGAITSKPKAEAMAALPAELRGATYHSPILALRRQLGLELSVRPSRSIPGNPRNFVRRAAATGALEEPRIDAVVVSQNTECLFAGAEWTAPPPAVHAALAAHPHLAHLANVPGDELAVSARIATRAACERAADAAFLHARARGSRSVTLCEKWGVTRETSAMMEAAARAAAARHPDVALQLANLDAQLLWLTQRPETFEVLLCSAFFGDLLSDALAGLCGGLGFAPAANLGGGHALFEPVHGSAPKYADRAPAIVNPIAAILAAAMLLEHLGEHDRARAVRAAVDSVVAAGRTRTFDMHGTATTDAMTRAIIAAL